MGLSWESVVMMSDVGLIFWLFLSVVVVVCVRSWCLVFILV